MYFLSSAKGCSAMITPRAVVDVMKANRSNAACKHITNQYHSWPTGMQEPARNSVGTGWLALCNTCTCSVSNPIYSISCKLH